MLSARDRFLRIAPCLPFPSSGLAKDCTMSRQDANAAFALTSFLYGGNAAYIDDLYGRYEIDPKSVDAEWQAFFQSLKDDARDVEKNAQGPSWARSDWPPLPRNDLVAALDGNWAEASQAIGGKVKAQAQTPRRRSVRGRRRACHPRFDPRADADPRLSRSRPFPRQSRSARPRSAEERGRARSAHLRL